MVHEGDFGEAASSIEWGTVEVFNLINNLKNARQSIHVWC